MIRTRRELLLSGLTTTLSASALAALTAHPDAADAYDGDLSKEEAAKKGVPRGGDSGLARRIARTWDQLPGKKALLIRAPATRRAREFVAHLNPGSQLFCASSFKGYVLAAYLRQVEKELQPGNGVPLADQWNAYLAQDWDLNEEVFSPGAPVFNPPKLVGKANILTVLEAMISRSDNTATDMTLNHADADRVRRFITAIGLRDTRIPTTTRQFFGYVAGYPDWPNITWDTLVELLENDPYPPNPIINDTITMVSTPFDFVSFYARALQGTFFRYAETRDVFRSILMLADAIPLAMPLGVNAFLKGGSIDLNPEHGLCLAGGMWIPGRHGGRWAYFATMVNWTDDQAGNVPDVLPSFLGAARQIFTSLRDELDE